MRTIALALMILGASGVAQAKTPPTKWTRFADCAAAYRANAHVADPDRPASMVAMISETADDYAKAAAKTYRRHARASEPQARRAVQAYVEKQTPIFAARSRAEVEHVIDACPQPDD